MVQGPDNRTYMLRQGDQLADGAVQAVTAEGLVIVQEVNDPLSLVKQRVVRKPLAIAGGRQAVTVTRGLALVLAVAVVGVVGGRPGTAADSPAAPSAKLKSISERQGRGGPSLVIEASEPVPYMTTRPDPLTVLLDFRNVGAEGVTNAVAVEEDRRSSPASTSNASSRWACRWRASGSRSASRSRTWCGATATTSSSNSSAARAARRT